MTDSKPSTTPLNTSSSTISSHDQFFSPELLGMYYSRLFPFGIIHSWLGYDPTAAQRLRRDNDVTVIPSRKDSIFSRREFSFTIEPLPGKEIYIRYLSFASVDELRTAVLKRRPTKIDIGAVFSHPPKDHLSVQGNGSSAAGSPIFIPEQRELVFDIDLTDYDDVRNCGCKGASICGKCWKMIIMAIKVVDEGLREDFGFKCIAWFYSGRRGVHAWVCDRVARDLTNEGRSAIANYFDVNLGSETNNISSLPHPLHPTLSRAYKILEPMFISDILPSNGHGLLATTDQWETFLMKLPTVASPVADALLSKWNSVNCQSTPEEKWVELKRYLFVFGGKGKSHDTVKKSKHLSTADKIIIEQWPILAVFTYTYPRLDINVSKMRNHLLKSPFCVHPKTGRVCVPIRLDVLDEFDPESVPTLSMLKKELDEYEQRRQQSRETQDVEPFQKDDDGSKMKERRNNLGSLKDMEYEWQKTSLRSSFEYFQMEILLPMLRDMKKEEVDERSAVIGEF